MSYLTHVHVLKENANGRILKVQVRAIVRLLTLFYRKSRNIHDNCYLEAVYYGPRDSDYIT
jgi:hypothetical protein